MLALLWKQVRQAAPIIATGLACALLVEASVLVGMWQAEEYDSVDRQAVFLQDFSGQAIGMFTFFGCLAGLVTGVGQSTTDLGSSLAQFWRSRPIHIDLWFAVMLGAGFVMLIIAFGAPVSLGLWVLSSYPVDWAPAAGTLAFSMLLLSYSAGLFSGCVIRQASYASLIGIAIVGLSYAALVKCFNWLSVSSEPDGYFGGAMALISAGMVLLAWLSVRKDWALSR